MTQRLAELIDILTSQEQMEVETFATFLLARRKIGKPTILTDDISSEELMHLVMESGSFDWLNAEEEDVYSLEDGEEVQWPSES